MAVRVMEAYRRGRECLARLEAVTEADTQDRLILPVLRALGYSDNNTRREVADADNKPDRVVWPVALDEMNGTERPARFLVEEKRLGTDFDKPGSSRTDTLAFGRWPPASALQPSRLSSRPRRSSRKRGGSWPKRYRPPANAAHLRC